MQSRRLTTLFLVFAVSGFSGLIYESIWSHYLKLFLGHAAYAQTLVLAIFMGGMALGSWLCSRYSIRWKRLFLGYAVAEGVIGLLAIVFHSVFDAATAFSYSSVFPALGSPATINAYKWILSALLILPQTVLLGMTFPLMSSGILRRHPADPGKTLAMLYFANSIGAAIGVLVSGFVIIRAMGLPGTIRTAGVINILIALVVWRLMTGRESEAAAISVPGADPTSGSRGWLYLLLSLSLFTGAASFIYETGWIRMLSLVLGSSTHAFELMLSAFILGLAFGGLWMRRRIDRLADPRRFLAWVQVVMGVLAIATLPVYSNSFRFMGWVLEHTSRTDGGYLGFTLASHGIAMCVMFPAAFCAGMTLPLITYALLGAGHGERSIGAVYAWNTVGAILGVIFAIHIGMPILGLKNLIVFGAAIDMTLGVAILWKLGHGARRSVPAAALAGCAILVVLVVSFVHLDPFKMASGVYRTGKLMTGKGSEIIYHQDGKTATVSVVKMQLLEAVQLNIRTNGKADASINVATAGGPTPDEHTGILTGTLPLAYRPDAKTAANIGLGSGLTTHTLLSYPGLAEVDTIEIEPAMVDGAKLFGDRVSRVFSDPRSRIHIDDAKTFFSSNGKRYDVIVSEPSNPWVSGVAGLFSTEFYALIGTYLNEGGVFCQWVQTYELSPELVATVMKSISANFADYVVYALNEYDLLILAGKQPLGSPDAGVLASPELAKALQRIGIRGVRDLELRRLGDRKVLDRFFSAFPIRANSDYHPVLDQNAERARFLGANAQELIGFTVIPLPVRDMLGTPPPRFESTRISPTRQFGLSLQAWVAIALRDYLLAGPGGAPGLPIEYSTQADNLQRLYSDCTGVASDQTADVSSIYLVFSLMTAFLQPEELEPVWESLASRPCARSLPERVQTWLALFRAVGMRDGQGMAREARQLLARERNIPDGTVRYLVATAMLGSLSRGDRAGALALWNEYGDVLYQETEPNMLFRLLVAESRADGD